MKNEIQRIMRNRDRQHRMNRDRLGKLPKERLKLRPLFFTKIADQEASDAYDEGGRLEESLRQVHDRYAMSADERAT